MVSSLINRNVIVDGHRTSVRPEAAMWDALFEIVRREHPSIRAILSQVGRSRRESTLTASLRVFILNYFRSAADSKTKGPIESANPLEQFGVGAHFPRSAHDGRRIGKPLSR